MISPLLSLLLCRLSTLRISEVAILFREQVLSFFYGLFLPRDRYSSIMLVSFLVTYNICQ